MEYYILAAYLANGIGYACATNTVAVAHGEKGGDLSDDIIWILLWPLFVLGAIIDYAARVIRGN